MASEQEGRTNKKLDFAELHLKEITSRPEMGSADDFEIAHEESFLFHLIGAKDSFLQEINNAYGLGLPTHRATAWKLKGKLERTNRKSPALDKIVELQDPCKAGWLAIAIELRNQGTHRRRTSRNFERKIGPQGVSGANYFFNPFTKEPMDIPIPEFLRECRALMSELLQELRATLPEKQ